jgi:hypothetical protein
MSFGSADSCNNPLDRGPERRQQIVAAQRDR